MTSLATTGKVVDKAFDPHGTRLAFVSNNLLSVWTPEHDDLTTIPPNHSQAFDALAFNSDGEYLAAATYNGDIRLWAIDGLREIAFAESRFEARPARYAIRSETLVTFSPDSNYLAVSTNQGEVALWNRRYGIWTHVESRPGSIEGLVFRADDALLLIGCVGLGKQVQDTDDLQISPTVDIDVQGQCILGEPFTISRDLTTSANSNASQLQIRDFETGDRRFSFQRPLAEGFNFSSPVLGIALSETGDRLAFGTGTDGHGGCCYLASVQIWEPEGDAEPWEISDEDELFAFPALAFDPNADVLAGGSLRAGRGQRPLYLWDVSALPESATNPLTLHGHTDTILDVEFNADGTLLASASADGTVRLWGVRVETQ